MKNKHLFIFVFAFIILAGILIFSFSGEQTPTPQEVELLKIVFPQADTFSAKTGEPPYYKVYQQDPQTHQKTQIGIAYLTKDIVPDERGYNGPIEMMVGCDLDGTISHVHLIQHSETTSLVGKLEEFLGQFIGKNINSPFQLDQDVDGITGATITSKAVAQTISKSLDIITSSVLKKQTIEPDRSQKASEGMKEKLKEKGIVPVEAKHWQKI